MQARGEYIKTNTETHRAQRKHSFERGWENDMNDETLQITYLPANLESMTCPLFISVKSFMMNLISYQIKEQKSTDSKLIILNL